MTMEPGELRIGDWVATCYGRTCRVVSIEPDRVNVVNQNDVECTIRTEFVKPVLLLKKIFVKNKFKAVEGMKSGTCELKMGTMNEKSISVFPMSRVEYYVEIDNSVDNRYARTRIAFVHELQHLLQDFKIDKEIELWM